MVASEPATPLAESHLISRVRAGDHECFSDLLAPHMRAARFMAKRIVGLDQDVDDVVQESARKALSKLHQFRFESSFGTWLLSIVANEARMARRRSSFSRTVALDSLDPQIHAAVLATPDAHSPLDAALTKCEEQRVERIVSVLPDKYQQVIRLRFHHNADVRQTADILGISISAVKSRQLRALQMMGRALVRYDFSILQQRQLEPAIR